MSERARAFTLIELLVIVVVIGILAAVAIPKFTNARAMSAASSAATQLRTFENALERHAASNGSYPLGHYDWKTSSPGLQAILNTDLFSKPTPVGGHYGYVGPDAGRARLTILPFSGGFVEEGRVTPDAQGLAEIDAILDDGVATTGRFRVTNNWSIYFLQ